MITGTSLKKFPAFSHRFFFAAAAGKFQSNANFERKIVVVKLLNFTPIFFEFDLIRRMY